MAGFAGLEAVVYNGMLSLVGEPIFLGFLVLSLFGLWVMVASFRLDAKMLGIVPAIIMAAAFMPIFVLVLGGLALGGILYFGVMKFMRR
jgi:predicted membrane protein